MSKSKRQQAEEAWDSVMKPDVENCTHRNTHVQGQWISCDDCQMIVSVNQ